MNRSCIWIRLQLPNELLSLLRQEFKEVEFLKGKGAEDRLSNIDAIFAEEPIPDNLLAQMPRLKWLHVTRGGAYPFLTPAIREKPIELTASKGIHGTVFSEFALALIFALTKKITRCLDSKTNKSWERFTPEQISGKTIGIVGLGTVGSELARKAKMLGLRVLAIKKTTVIKPEYVDEVGTPDYLPSLLAESDFVVLCIPSVPSTECMIGQKELRSMKKSAYLINLTAGKAVDETFLIRALKESWIAGAALDAFPRQPLPRDSELWNLPNVIISPRVAGVSEKKWDSVFPIFVDNLKRFIEGKELQGRVDKEKGY